MKKDWLEDIHDRMADFEVEVPVTRDQREQPQGLWDDICAAEQKAKATPVIGKPKHNQRLWIGSAAAVAACLLLLWGIRPDQEQGPVSSVTSGEQIASTHLIPTTDNQEGLLEQTSADLPSAEHGRNAAIAPRRKAISDTSVRQKQDPPTNDSKESKPASDQREQQQPTSDQQQQQPKPASGHREQPQKRHEYLAQSSPRKQMTEPRLTIGLTTSGGIGSDNRQLFQGGLPVTSSTLNESDWMDSPLLGIMALNRGAETERKVRHHSPFRTGLSFSYRLNDRWSLESGLSYAFVSSDIHEGSTAHFIDEEQHLHYVGIPLGVTYRLLTWKRLDLYLSTDVLAEQCVAAQSRKRFILGDKMQGEEKSYAIDSRPMQWSVGAKAGVQYNLNSLFSIYAEPGCRYYFDDHSSLETVFKDKAFDINLNVGLRFTVGN